LYHVGLEHIASAFWESSFVMVLTTVEITAMRARNDVVSK